MRRIVRGNLVACTVLTILIAIGVAGPARGADLALSAGAFDVGGQDELTLAEFGLEIRSATYLAWGLGWMGGVSANEEGGFWAHLGMRRPFGSRWFATPSLAVVLYEQGDGKDLGNTLEFRSSIELGYRFANRMELGVGFYHLSNASISDVNPGSNSLIAVFSIPLGGGG